MGRRVRRGFRATASCLLLFSLQTVAADGPEKRNAALTDNDGRVRAQLVARNEVVLSSELSAKIESLPLREGAAFRAGQLLVGFDCTLFKAQLNKAESALDAARQTLAVNQRLAELNSIGKLEVELADARVKESQAEAAYMHATVSKCAITAPFSGRVVKRIAAAFQFVTPGTPLLAIQDAEELEIRMIVPSKWIATLKPGARFSLQVDELGKSFSARVLRTGARIDPISQSVDVIGAVDGTPSALLPGMSGWAVFAGSL
jgi:membrane fusion protein (multidrug efflux system)